MISREAVAKAYRDAADALEAGDFEGHTCCGLPLTELGQCKHRPGHPTVGNPNPMDYPEVYEPDGTLIQLKKEDGQ